MDRWPVATLAWSVLTWDPKKMTRVHVFWKNRAFSDFCSFLSFWGHFWKTHVETCLSKWAIFDHPCRSGPVFQTRSKNDDFGTFLEVLYGYYTSQMQKIVNAIFQKSTKIPLFLHFSKNGIFDDFWSFFGFCPFLAIWAILQGFLGGYLDTAESWVTMEEVIWRPPSFLANFG